MHFNSTGTNHLGACNRSAGRTRSGSWSFPKIARFWLARVTGARPLDCLFSSCEKKRLHSWRLWPAYFLHRSARLRDTSRVTRFIFIAVCLFLESFGSPRSTELPRDSEATITLRVPLIPGPSMSRDALGQTATSTDFGNSVANSYVDDTLCLACEVFFFQAELFWNKYYATLINMLALIPHYFDQNKFDTNHFIFLWKLCNVNLRVM